MQVDFSRPDSVRFPDFVASDGVEVLLEPGDTLYIPPFWWHRIETLTPAAAGWDGRGAGSSSGSGGGSGKGSGKGSGAGLSLSVVSPSGEEALLAAATWVALPFLDADAAAEPRYLPTALGPKALTSEAYAALPLPLRVVAFQVSRSRCVVCVCVRVCVCVYVA